MPNCPQLQHDPMCFGLAMWPSNNRDSCRFVYYLQDTLGLLSNLVIHRVATAEPRKKVLGVVCMCVCLCLCLCLSLCVLCFGFYTFLSMPVKQKLHIYPTHLAAFFARPKQSDFPIYSRMMVTIKCDKYLTDIQCSRCSQFQQSMTRSKSNTFSFIATAELACHCGLLCIKYPCFFNTILENVL